MKNKSVYETNYLVTELSTIYDFQTLRLERRGSLADFSWYASSRVLQASFGKNDKQLSA